MVKVKSYANIAIVKYWGNLWDKDGVKTGDDCACAE